MAVRNVRRDAMKAIEKLEKDGGISGARRTPGRGGAARGRGRERPRAALAGWRRGWLAGWLGAVISVGRQVQWHNCCQSAIPESRSRLFRCQVAAGPYPALPAWVCAEDQRKDWRMRCRS